MVTRTLVSTGTSTGVYVSIRLRTVDWDRPGTLTPIRSKVGTGRVYTRMSERVEDKDRGREWGHVLRCRPRRRSPYRRRSEMWSPTRKVTETGSNNDRYRETTTCVSVSSPEVIGNVGDVWRVLKTAVPSVSTVTVSEN